MAIPSVSTQREQVRRRQPNYGMISGALPFSQSPGEEAGTGSLTLPGGFIPPPAPLPISQEPIQGGGTRGGRIAPPIQTDPARPPRGTDPGTSPIRGGGPVGPPIQLPDAFKGRVGREGNNPVAGGMMTNIIPPPPTPTSTLNTGGFQGTYTPTTKPLKRRRGGLGSFGMY